EDCIRDATVTGVQTCALPIYDRLALRADHPRGSSKLSGGYWAAPVLEAACPRASTQASGHVTVLHLPLGERPANLYAMSQGPFARVLRTYGTGGRSPYSLLKSPRLPLCPHPDYKAVARSKATAEAGEKR